MAAMLSRRGLLVRAVLVAALAVLLAGARPGNAAFPGANGRIAYTCAPDGQEICVVNSDGSSLGYLTQGDRGGGDYDERYPAWSPDGRRIAFVVVGNCANAIYVMNSNRTGLHRVLLEKSERSGMWTIQDLSWSPDGTSLVYGKSFQPGGCSGGSVEVQRIFTISVAGTGERQITAGVLADRDMQPAWSPDGQWVAFHHEPMDRGLYVMKPDGSSRRLLDNRGAGYPDWSPDGTKIVYHCTTTRAEICVYTEGGGIDRLGPGTEPVFSPDGTRILFVLQPGEGGDSDGGIYVMAADGSGRVEIVSSTGYEYEGRGHPDWQPCRGTCPPAAGMPGFVKRTLPPPILRASVGPGFTISLRNKARRKVKSLEAGSYSVRLRDRSPRHSFHVKGKKFDAGTTVRAVSNRTNRWVFDAGKYRFFCDAHRGRMHGRFRVVPRPYRP